MKHVKTFEGFFSRLFGGDKIGDCDKMTTNRDGDGIEGMGTDYVIFGGRKFEEDDIVYADAKDPKNNGFENKSGILPRIGYREKDSKNDGKLIIPGGDMLKKWLKSRGLGSRI
jgi:hypothetical protein